LQSLKTAHSKLVISLKLDKTLTSEVQYRKRAQTQKKQNHGQW